MNILITGSSGLVGQALIPFLTAAGHRVSRLVRSTPRSILNEIYWDPESNTLDPVHLENTDGVVHLAGESIAKGRWTSSKKERILESRIKGTKLLCETLSTLNRPPEVLVSASAIGYYGDRGEEVVTETAPLGTGFLANVCQKWEAMTESASRKGVRVVNLRIGLVLSASGGALSQMLLPFKMGLGGTLGSGKQYMSWISIDDLLGAILHALTRKEISGPVNVVSPNPVTNREFTRKLGHVLRRPTPFPLPKFMLKLLFGEFADEALLVSTRVMPIKLLDTAFIFQYPELENGLSHLLRKA